jgi:hypothetical protein
MVWWQASCMQKQLGCHSRDRVTARLWVWGSICSLGTVGLVVLIDEKRLSITSPTMHRLHMDTHAVLVAHHPASLTRGYSTPQHSTARPKKQHRGGVLHVDTIPKHQWHCRNWTG